MASGGKEGDDSPARQTSQGAMMFVSQPAVEDEERKGSRWTIASSGLGGSVATSAVMADSQDGRTALSRSAISQTPSASSSVSSMGGLRDKSRRDVAVYAGNGRFQFQAKIGAGAFGQVYQGLDLTTQRSVAIKLEKKGHTRPQLDVELKLYKLLNRVPRPGVPRIYYYGSEGPFHVLVMELLGPSLEDLMTYCQRKMSLKTTLLLGEQMISVVENIHSEGFIHRDIKPENFTMGIGEKGHILYLVDFGLAKRFRDKSGEHIPFRTDKGFTGTARYASIGTHLGNEQSRRDDIESLLYVMIFFVRGELPWQGVKAVDRAQKKKLIQEKKQSLSPDDLCKGLPHCLLKIARYCHQLEFEEQPDYDMLRRWIREEQEAHSIQRDFMYDWFDHYGDNKLKGPRPPSESGSTVVSASGRFRTARETPDLEMK
eukprot:TRINITY_DN3742_c0_g1_i3.p1 TRINITY_DN3742_c0_g1~~TRINITY_DN3742_c0_g1_i3.p1  ORF type:complete len:428 (+),score=114.26 TRINITY_DN3742_c0_g1_i3:117-1400(+)